MGDSEGSGESEDTGTSEGSGATSGAGTSTGGSVDPSSATSDSGCEPVDCECMAGCEPVATCDDGAVECECDCSDTASTTDATTGIEPDVCPGTPIMAASQLAYRYADLPSGGGSGSGSGGSGSDTTGGGGVDPDTLFVELGTEVLACGESPTYACSNWRVTIGIPPEYQVPGVYDIEGTDITLSYTIQGEPHGNDPEDCSFGGGGGFGGTLEIFAIDDDEVYGALCSSDLFEVQAAGVFTAMRC